MQTVLAVPAQPMSNPTCPCIQQQPVATHFGTTVQLQEVDLNGFILDECVDGSHGQHLPILVLQLLLLHLGMPQGEDGVVDCM